MNTITLTDDLDVTIRHDPPRMSGLPETHKKIMFASDHPPNQRQVSRELNYKLHKLSQAG